MMMTDLDIANHNAICAELAADDGIPRLTWEQHTAAFKAPQVDVLAPGTLVAAWDSATPGTVGALRDGKYDVTFRDVGGVCRYPALSLRPWPVLAANIVAVNDAGEEV